MVVVVAGGEERGVEPGGRPSAVTPKPRRVAVEGERAVEVGDAQVHVADADGGMDGLGLHAGQSPGRGARPPSVDTTYPRPG